MGWRKKVEGGSAMVADLSAVREALGLFLDPDHGCEVIALKSGIGRTLPAADVDGLVDAVQGLPSGFGVYFRINPVTIGRAGSAKNSDVVKRRWLYIDVDPIKAEGCEDSSASDGEKEATAETCQLINDYLSDRGWPAPVVTDSGNGFGMFYPCDLPNDAYVQAAYRKVVFTLHSKFSGKGGIVDKSIHNANRLAKIPGTWARKGPQSDDRPHRPCRLTYVPSELGSVTMDMLHAAGGDEPTPPRAESATWSDRSAGPGTANYAKRALDSECARVLLSKPGERNNCLNRAAFSLGQLVAGGVLDRSIVESRLYDAARACGLLDDPGCGERGVRNTIASGMTAAMDSPRGVPESKQGPKATFTKKTHEGNGKHEPEEKATDGQEGADVPLTINLSKVTPLQVEWLIQNRIPRKFITVFAGRSGAGKSFVAFDLIARISRGEEIPCGRGERFKVGSTLILSEDSHEYVIAPRLINAGADMTKIHVMTWEAMAKFHLSNVDMLARACDEIEGGPTLLLVDPPTNFLEGVDEHKNAEVRQLVMKVVEFALKRELAVLFILHVNKGGKGVAALDRVMGSVAWITTARVAHAFADDPNERGQKLWLPLKNNLGELPPALSFRLVRIEGGRTNEAKVEWGGEMDTTADDAMGGFGPRERRDVSASKWIIGMFRQSLEWESKALFDAGMQEGISRDAIFEAKRLLNLPRAKKVTKENGDITWVWWVPSDWPQLAEGEEDDEMGQP